jgi:hypothetical protein
MGAKAIVRGVLAGLVLTAVTMSYGSFDRPIKITSKDDKEVKYYDTKFARGVRSVFYNFRDGSLGLIQNVWQLGTGVAAGSLILPGKVLVFAGDVVGFADDNIFIRPFLRGIVSDTIEEISYFPFRQAKGIMLMTHELDDISIVPDREEYVDDDVVFKTRLYLRPYTFVVVPVTVISDGVIRPIGNIAKIFSLRRFTDMEVEDVPDRIDRFGLRMIMKAYNLKFIFPIPEEEEPDIRVYTEEEVSGVKPPGPMRRPQD